jgi:hypothetical protein
MAALLHIEHRGITGYLRFMASRAAVQACVVGDETGGELHVGEVLAFHTSGDIASRFMR